MKSDNKVSLDGYLNAVSFGGREPFTGNTARYNGTLEIITGAGKFQLPYQEGFDRALSRAAERTFKNRAKIKITVEFPESDIDEARQLLKTNTSGALEKFLDILERLDK